jgi:GntR family transcriptional repressor for pyruvate dehydrogenase complex
MASYRDIAITADQLEPIHRETVMAMVARRIEQLVRGGELKAGDRLPPEPDLAQMLRVSRGSLREALKGLMYLGLIKSRAGDGTYIQSSLSRMLNQHFQWMILLDEVKHLEIYELRKIIEPDAAALAAKRATRADIESLEAALDGLAEGRGNPELFHAFDIQFHDAFAQASGNAAIQNTMRMLYHATSEARKACCHLSMTGIGIGGGMNACSLVFAIASQRSPAKRCWMTYITPKLCLANMPPR